MWANKGTAQYARRSHNANIFSEFNVAPMATIHVFLTSSSKARRAVEALPVWAGAKAAAEPRMAARQAAVFMFTRESVGIVNSRAKVGTFRCRSRRVVQSSLGGLQASRRKICSSVPGFFLSVRFRLAFASLRQIESASTRKSILHVPR